MNEERKFRFGEPVILSKSYVRFKLKKQGEKVPDFLLNDSPTEITMFVNSWRVNNDLGYILCKFLYNLSFNDPLYQIELRDVPEGRLQSASEHRESIVKKAENEEFKFKKDDQVSVSMGWLMAHRRMLIPEGFVRQFGQSSRVSGEIGFCHSPVTSLNDHNSYDVWFKYRDLYYNEHKFKIQYIPEEAMLKVYGPVNSFLEDKDGDITLRGKIAAMKCIDEWVHGIDPDIIATAVTATNQLLSTGCKLTQETIEKAINSIKAATPPPFLPDYDTIMNMHLYKTDIKKNESEGKEMIQPDYMSMREAVIRAHYKNDEEFETAKKEPLIPEEEDAKLWVNALFTPKQIIFNPPATIVFWKDGTKTTVKCEPNEKFNKYHGFCAAVCKKMYNSNSALNKMIASVDISKEGQMRLNAQKVTIPSYEQKSAAKPQKGIRLKEEPKKKSPVKKGSRK